jgi:xanthine dehydrogenase YagR molybdenum-binding subunit
MNPALSDSSQPSMDRVDGRLKVTGAATYSAEYPFDTIAHAVLITSTIAKGRILSIQAKPAETARGVLAVISHLNSPGVPSYETVKNPPERSAPGREFQVFHDAFVYFSGQPVAMIVAGTLEQAVHAASLVKISYETEEHRTDFEANSSRADIPVQVQRNPNSPFKDYDRGNPQAANDAEVKTEAKYIVPTMHHQPLEPHAIIAVWEGDDKLTVYDKNQGVKSVQGNLARAFKLPAENVHVVSRFIGGAFGYGRIRLQQYWPPGK